VPQVLFVEEESSEGPSPAEGALRGAEAFDLHRARRAEAALEEKGLFQGGSGPMESEIDVLVTAHFLPRLNGLGLTEELREAGANVPIMLLTSRQDAEARAEALRRGADDCISRPPHAKQLTARLRALLRLPDKWEPVKEIQVGPLLVDTPRQEARAYGNPLDLRKKEFNLLYCLADRHPTPVKRDQIAARVWGNGVVSDNSIDVTMASLRKKLKGALPEEGAGVRIETVRKVGYRLRLGSEERSHEDRPGEPQQRHGTQT
jgi:DNA-binding response OmpR family regulator